MAITYTCITPEENFYEVVMIGDVNDADYVTTIIEYNEEEFMELLPYLRALLLHFMERDIGQLDYCEIFEAGNICTCNTGDEYDQWRYDECLIRLRPRELEGINTSDISEFLDLPRDDQGRLCHNLISVTIRWFTSGGYVYEVEID